MYYKSSDDFTVVVKDLIQYIEEIKRFTHVIVATAFFFLVLIDHYTQGLQNLKVG